MRVTTSSVSVILTIRHLPPRRLLVCVLFRIACAQAQTPPAGKANFGERTSTHLGEQGLKGIIALSSERVSLKADMSATKTLRVIPTRDERAHIRGRVPRGRCAPAERSQRGSGRAQGLY